MYVLGAGTLVAAALAVLVAQVGFAVPAVLNGLFQQDLGPTSSQLTWISDAFIVPVALLELTFGVLGDLFGRKRLLVGGALVLAIGEGVAVLTPGAGSSTGTRVLVLWIGQIIAGIGAAALFPTSLAMVAAGTHTASARARAIAVWAAALATGGLISSVLGGLMTRIGFGTDPSASWRWAFVAVLILALASAAISLAMAQNSAAPEGRSLDWPGQVTVAVALFALLFAVIQAPTSGWGSGQVVAGFIVAALFLALFIWAERRSPAPLLRLDFFTHRVFAVNAVVTVVGMFAFVGTAYVTSIRLTAIQGFTPLKASVAFVFLGGLTLVQMPLTSRLLERYNPKWVLGGGFALIGAGDLWLAAVPATNLSLAAIVAPLVIAGIGFALAVSSVTAVAVNAMPNHLAGMASGTTNMLRDLGFGLGPAVIGAVALSQAAAQISRTVAGSASLRGALAGFTASAAHAPAAQRPALEAAVGAVQSGPLGANAVPATVPVPGGHVVPFNPLKDVAFHALSHAYSIGYVICAVAALAAALLAVVGVGGRAHETQTDPRTLTEQEAAS
ncbi:MFS transporter [Trebonia kvetii]|uniref:MFS transporter n=2 Tax=Trebonia kvetii TaxID=2480626 RepID=A0A6P2C877_9ACTN|nr:MFS transporter [Trebonia kvetii]